MGERERMMELFQRCREGDSGAARDVLPLVYSELRGIARARMRKLAPGQTLQPTALVHEAYMRIAGDDSSFEGEQEFFFVAARAIRDILVENARRKAATKRGGDHAHVSTDGIDIAIEPPTDDILALDGALAELEETYPRKHELVMLHFFSGLTLKQAASILGVSERTAERDWRFARARLHSILHDEDD